MRRLLLIVEAAFDLPPGGATLLPALPADTLRPPFLERITLRLPDGREIETRARFSMTRFNRPYSERTIENTWMLVVARADGSKAEVPTGTEVWIEADGAVSSSAPHA
jgi:hypothetical protein